MNLAQLTQLYANLRVRGVDFFVQDGEVWVDDRKAQPPLTDEEFEALQKHKAELLKLLTDPCMDCGRPAQPTWPPHLSVVQRFRCRDCVEAAQQQPAPTSVTGQPVPQPPKEVLLAKAEWLNHREGCPICRWTTPCPDGYQLRTRCVELFEAWRGTLRERQGG
ncbi:MAG: hypothetical protein C4316_04310 [Chloroflexota bacterium]